VPKIASECCELVKLCHINCSGQVFFRYTVVVTIARCAVLRAIVNAVVLTLSAHVWTNPYKYTLCLKKLHLFCFCNNLVECQPISIFFCDIDTWINFQTYMRHVLLFNNWYWFYFHNSLTTDNLFSPRRGGQYVSYCCWKFIQVSLCQKYRNRLTID